MASHLLFTEWISTHAGPTPDLIKDGYPLGPHAIVAATAKVSGASLIEGFAGLTGAIAVLLALTAYGALRGVRGWLRVPAAVLAASPYLAAAYLAQGAFKEPLLGLALLGFALALPPPAPGLVCAERPGDPSQRAVRDVRDPARGDRRGHDLQLQLPRPRLAARRRRDLDAGHRAAGAGPGGAPCRRPPPAASGSAVPGPHSCSGSGSRSSPPCPRSSGSRASRASRPSTRPAPGPTVGFGNLRQPLNPLEAFGIWPSGEFRITPGELDHARDRLLPRRPARPGRLRLGTGAGARRGASRRCPRRCRRRRSVYLAALAVGTPYTQAKALAIAAPLIMLIALRGLLSADAIEGEESAVPEGGARLVAAAACSGRSCRSPSRCSPLAFAAAAAFSTLLPLRQAAVGPDYHLQEMLRDAADRRRPERALPRPRQLRLLGADRLGGLRADHQPLRRRGGPRPLPRDRPERQVRLGQRPGRS